MVEHLAAAEVEVSFTSCYFLVLLVFGAGNFTVMIWAGVFCLIKAVL